MVLTYRYRVQMTKAAHRRFEEAVDHTTQLYNAALQERIGAYRFIKRKEACNRPLDDLRVPNKFEQYKSLTILRADPEMARYAVTMQRWALMRVDEAFKGFFKRLKKKRQGGLSTLSIQISDAVLRLYRQDRMDAQGQ